MVRRAPIAEEDHRKEAEKIACSKNCEGSAQKGFKYLPDKDMDQSYIFENMLDMFKKVKKTPIKRSIEQAGA